METDLINFISSEISINNCVVHLLNVPNMYMHGAVYVLILFSVLFSRFCYRVSSAKKANLM